MPTKNLTVYSKSRSVVTRFVFKRSVKSAILWAVILGAYVASKSIGFAKLYSTHEQRVKFASSFGSNSGLSLILGKPHDIITVPGYTAWNTLGIATIVLAIWAILQGTKYLRGEEMSGRLELLLSGQSSLKMATAAILKAMLLSLFVLFIIAGLFFSAIGADKKVGFNATDAFFLSLAITLSGLAFMSLSALVSQLVSTRGKAAGISASLFGIFFLLKAFGDSTKLTWLTNLSPLGWIENSRPLAQPRPMWVLPVLAFSAICLGATLFLASKRDLGGSLIKDKQENKAKLRFLATPFAVNFRLSMTSTLAWALGIFGLNLFYGALTKPAIQALNDSSSTKKAFKSIVSAGGAHSNAAVFVSLTFLISMVVLFLFSAYLINHIRSDEAEGRLDNFLVGPISRIKWLGSRLAYSSLVIVVVSLIGALAIWIGTLSLHDKALSLHSLLLAGLNTIPATLLVLAIGVFVLGFIPRLTSIAAYTVIGWSFLIDMLQSGTKINHWLLDTSIFTHVHLAPAASINWGTNLILLGLASGLAILGTLRFRSRDITSE